MKRYPLNDGWYFTEQFTRQLTTLERPEPELVPVRLPHTVKLLPFNEFSEQAYQMVSGYLRFLVPPESWHGQRVRVVFEGAAHQARVYLNGQLLAQHACGYTAFTVTYGPSALARHQQPDRGAGQPGESGCAAFRQRDRLPHLRRPLPGGVSGGGRARADRGLCAYARIWTAACSACPTAGTPKA